MQSSHQIIKLFKKLLIFEVSFGLLSPSMHKRMLLVPKLHFLLNQSGVAKHMSALFECSGFVLSLSGNEWDKILRL